MVGTNEIEAHTGIAKSTIRQWIKEGVIPQTDSMSDVVKAIIAYYKGQKAEALRDRSIGEGGKNTYAYQKMRLTLAQADKVELENREREGELVEADQVAMAWSAYIAACKSRLLGVPTRLALELAGTSDPKEIQAIIQESIDEALLELSNAEFVQRLEPARDRGADVPTPTPIND